MQPSVSSLLSGSLGRRKTMVAGKTMNVMSGTATNMMSMISKAIKKPTPDKT